MTVSMWVTSWVEPDLQENRRSGSNPIPIFFLASYVIAVIDCVAMYMYLVV